jgi:hypothetical protein
MGLFLSVLMCITSSDAGSPAPSMQSKDLNAPEPLEFSAPHMPNTAGEVATALTSCLQIIPPIDTLPKWLKSAVESLKSIEGPPEWTTLVDNFCVLDFELGYPSGKVFKII